MSLLTFNLAPAQVLVLTDTLATRPGGVPYLFVSKCHVVPHLEMVVAHTGHGAVGHRWALQLQTAMLAKDVDMLDVHTPGALRSLRAELAKEPGTAEASSTIYHMGYSLTHEKYVGYVYRSESNFESEVMEPGYRIKPAPLTPKDTPTSLEEMIELGKQLRAEQDSLSPGERVYIGGDLVCTALAGRTASIAKVYRFDDYPSDWLTMNTGLGTS